MIKRNPNNTATFEKYTNADGKTLGEVIDKNSYLMMLKPPSEKLILIMPGKLLLMITP